MLRSNSKSLGNHVVSPEEENERLHCEGFAEKEGFKSGMKDRVGPSNADVVVGGAHTSALSACMLCDRLLALKLVRQSSLKCPKLASVKCEYKRRLGFTANFLYSNCNVSASAIFH